MYNVILTKSAHKDLDTIYSYIAFNLDSKIAANNFLTEVEKSYSNLQSNPSLYAYCNDKRLAHLKYRRVVIKKYILIFKIDEIKKIVYVLRFFHGKQNYEKFF